MLTKSDIKTLQNIVQEVVKGEIKPINTRFDRVEKRLDNIEEQVKPIKRMATDVRRIRKDLDYVIGTYNQDIVYTRRRVEIIEKHLKLPSTEKPPPQN